MSRGRERNSMAKRRTLIVGLLAAVTAAAATATPAAAAATGPVRLAGTATAVPDSYIVVLKAGGKAPSTLAKSFGGQVRQSFGTINAYEASMTAYQAKRLAASPDVAYVEQNQTVSLL